MTEQSDKPSVDGLMELVADALRLILPMAKGYAAAHPVGANAEKVEHAEAVIAALAGPLEQPQEPKSDQANLAQASGGDASKTARPASHDVTTCPYFGMYLDLSEASGYPHEKDTMVSPEEYAADLKRDALAYRALPVPPSDEQRVADYEAGWNNCAIWAGREDLLGDTDSPAYIEERDALLRTRLLRHSEGKE